MSHAAGFFAAVLNLFSLGAGYAFCGRLVQAALTLVGSFVLFFLLSFLAAYSPWFVVFGGLFVLLLIIGVAFDSFRNALRPMLKPRFLHTAVYILIFAIAFNFVYLPARRVIFQSITDNSMEPTFQPGDRYALDREYVDFKPGDVVVAEADDQRLIVRRIQEITADNVILINDNKVHSRTQELPRAALHGKIAYILYSLDPDSWTIPFSRWLLGVN